MFEVFVGISVSKKGAKSSKVHLRGAHYFLLLETRSGWLLLEVCQYIPFYTLSSKPLAL